MNSLGAVLERVNAVLRDQGIDGEFWARPHTSLVNTVKAATVLGHGRKRRIVSLADDATVLITDLYECELGRSPFPVTRLDEAAWEDIISRVFENDAHD